MSKAPCVIIKKERWQILSSKRNEKEGIFSCHERGTKKKSGSPTGIEPMTSRTPVGCSITHGAFDIADPNPVSKRIIFWPYILYRYLEL